MFYPVESLRRGGRFYLCWLADSWPERFATITQRQLWSHDIRKICDDLLKVMTSESGRPVNRFSLRLSSQLMRGLVRLYQRKVSLYLVDLCMTNSSVFRHINKKGHVTEVMVTEHVLPQLPVVEQRQVVPDEPENEQQVAELIQNSGNVVSNIQDITLKEAVIPDFQLPPNDGFGEENPDQALQLAVDRTIETMMRADMSAQQISALSAVLDTTEHDRTRLAPLDIQMEAEAEMDVTLLRKSLGQDLLGAGDYRKDIPEIPEIPIPEMPVPEPQPEKQTPEPPPQQVPPVHDAQGVQPAPEIPVDIQLEELEEPPTKRRRKHRLIIDKNTKIAASVLHARIGNPRVELRCEDVTNDVIDLRLPVDLYFRRPAHAGIKPRSNIANELTRLFLRNLGVAHGHQPDDREMELPRVQRSLRHPDRSMLERIEEEAAVHDKTQPVIQPVDQLMDNTKDATYLVDQPIDKTVDAVIEQLVQTEQPVQVEVDIADLPTQKLETTSQAEKRKSTADTSQRKRLRPSDYTSFRLSQQLAIEAEIPITEAEKENIPQSINQQSSTKSPEKSQRNVLSMLEQAGLADVAEPRLADTAADTIHPSLDKAARKNGSESSETPLGSLDRTKVSLGDSDKTTDSIRLIRDQWGTVGTMTKIMQAIKYAPERPITVWYLMSKGPVIEKYKHIIAARCFTSILKLKHHGFIIVRKDPETLEIRNIILGPKFD